MTIRHGCEVDKRLGFTHAIEKYFSITGLAAAYARKNRIGDEKQIVNIPIVFATRLNAGDFFPGLPIKNNHKRRALNKTTSVWINTATCKLLTFGIECEAAHATYILQAIEFIHHRSIKFTKFFSGKSINLGNFPLQVANQNGFGVWSKCNRKRIPREIFEFLDE